MKEWFKRHRIFVRSLMVLMVVTGGFRGLFYYAETRFYRGMIPAPIETSGRYYIDGKADWWGGGCGIAIFHLSEKTIRRLEAEGITFLSGARLGRAKRLIGKEVSADYAKWKETPVSSEWLSNGLGPGFGESCSVEPMPDFYKKILTALKSPKSFYTRNKGAAALYVLPSIKIVVFEYHD